MIRFMFATIVSTLMVAPSYAIVRTWDGGAGTLAWNAPANWNPDGVPTAADDAVVNVSGNPIVIMLPAGTSFVKSLSCNQTLYVPNPAILSIANPSSTSGLQLEGILRGAGNLTITTNLKWKGGGMEGTGSTIVGNNATFVLEDGLMNTFLQRTFYNLGTGVYLDGLSFIDGTFVNHGELTVGNGRTFQLIASNGAGLNNAFVNHGTMHKLPLTDLEFFINGAGNVMKFDNHGLVIIDQGDFQLMSGTSSGDFIVNQDGLLRLGGFGPHALTETGSITGGGDGWWDIHFSNIFDCQGEVDLQGSVFLNGSSNFGNSFSAGQLSCINNGVVNFNGPVTLMPGAAHDIDDITLNFNAVDSPSFISGVFDNATIGGTGVVHVNANSQFGSCGIVGTGDLVVERGVVVELSTDSNKTISRNLVNYGLIEAGDLIRLDGGAIHNHGEFLASVGSQLTFILERVAGDVAFHNYGTFTKMGAGLFWLSNVPFNNSGTLASNQGTLSLWGGGVNEGTIVVADPSKVSMHENHLHDQASSIAGAGDLALGSGTHTLNGAITLTGQIEINGVSDPIVAFGQSCPNLDVVNFGFLQTDVPQSWRRLNLRPNAIIAGAGSIAISEMFIFHGEAVGSGQISTGSAATLLAGSSNAILKRTFIHNGTGTLGTGIVFDSGAFINKGVITIANTCALKGQAGINLFENTGTIIKNGAATASFVANGAALPLFNNGSIELNQGTILVESGGNGTGEFHVKPASTLRFNSDYNGGTFIVEGLLGIGSNRQLHASGEYVQASTGQLQINAVQGGKTPLVCANGAQIDGTLRALCTSLPPPFTTFPIIDSTAGEIVGEFGSQILVPPGMVNYQPQHASFTTYAHGDTNGDGVIDVTDLLFVINGWGACPLGCAADVNASGSINVDDLMMIILNWS